MSVRFSLILILQLIGLTDTWAQPAPQNVNFLVVGQRCPDFTFSDVHYFPKKQVSLNDFKGKWLLLDCWNENCSGCIAGMPTINRMQKQFADKVQYLLVGYTGSLQGRKSVSDPTIRTLYEKVRKAGNLQLPVAFDSTFLDTHQIYAGPYCIVIDPDGIVRALTGPLNESQLTTFIAGKTPVYAVSYPPDGQEQNAEPTYDSQLPFLTKGTAANAGSDTAFLFRSLLSEWNRTIPRYMAGIAIDVAARISSPPQSRTRRFELIGEDLKTIYTYAYLGQWNVSTWDSALYGNFCPHLVLETKDSVLFMQTSALWEYRSLNSKDLFCYSLTVPAAKVEKKYLMGVMQRDLQNYFGYNVTVETRKMAYWRLIVPSEKARARLRTKGQPFTADTPSNGNQGIAAKNFPIRNLANLLSVHYPDEPVIDESGLGNIDLTLDVLMTDDAARTKALHDQGIELVKGYKDMKCIVIRDK